MSESTRWRRRVLTLLTVAATTLLMAAVAQSPARAAPSASPGTQSAKEADVHYTAAPCNSAEKNYLRTDFARCFAMVRTALNHDITADPNDPPPTALGPAQIQDAYNLPATGQGQTVAIVDAFGDSHAETDLGQFRSFFGLTPCTSANGCFTKVDQNGGTNYPTDDPGWGLETSLDLDAVSAACPNCKILLVEGTDNSLDSLGIAVNTAVAMGAKYVSNSYGVPGEAPDELSFDQYYTHAGVAVTASTGDTGDVTNWPATNPNVVGVGGTTLTQDSSSRGWNETAWADGGSGCSPYEPHPDYQTGINTQCGKRAIADISADADPATGLAVYDTLGYSGWLQVGGTSLSSPLVASMYALAGTPVPGTFPVTYPYQAPTGGLYDITAGSNGGCGNVLCNAGPGWDGPTGLGTPNGVSALTTGPHGDIVGRVTNNVTGDGVSGASVSTADGYSATTEADGSYDLAVPVGSYDVTAAAFGYRSKTATGVQVNDGQSTTANFALAAVPSHNLSGTLADGSGHAWPLYAKITIDGYPNGAVYTDPYTGHYSVDLPQGFTANMHVEPVLPGYVALDKSVRIGTADRVVNLRAVVDQSTCVTPGYAYRYDGSSEAFAGWTDTTTQDSWTNVDNNGSGEVWQFDNPGNRAVPPGGDADFAILDSDHYGVGHSQNASLVSPVIDLSGQTTPEIGFDSTYRGFSNSTADVDLSLDGGQTWSNVWHQTTASPTGHVDVQIPQAAGQSNVQVRFHYSGTFAWWWEIDNVFIGNRACVAAQHGGLVAGIVHDNNTGNPINGAKVANTGGDFGISAATPDDPNLSDGFYSMFSSLTGAQQFTVTDGKYVPASASVNVAANYVTHQDWTLKAGHLSVAPGGLSVTERLGVAKSKTFTLTDDGTEPVHVKLGEQGGGFTPMAGLAGSGAPKTLIKGTFTPEAAVLESKSGAQASSATQLRTASPAAPPWADIADYPNPVMDNAVGYNDGKVYSVAGFNGTANVGDGFVYDPSAGNWSAIADLPEALESPGGSFVDGKMYVVGGWNAAGNASTHVYAYDPAADSWAQVANLPAAVSAPGVASLDGKLYVVGGCTTGFCAPTSTATFSYDPGSDSWSTLAQIPAPAAFPACAGIVGELVCAGGINADNNHGSKATYIYDPGSNSWSQGADMPYDDWAMSYSGANDRLQIAGGAINNGAALTNQAAEYDPASNSWSALPNANDTEYRGGGSCGMYKIGGSTGGFAPAPFAEVLPGYDQCGASDVPWMSLDTTEFDLGPGASVTVTVTMDSSVVPQPGAYTAKVAIGTDTPYSFTPVGVSMQVNPPASWGKIRGTVSSAVDGSPLAGATVQIGTLGGTGVVTYTLKSDASGYYQLWLDAAYSPLQVIVAKDGYQPQVKSVNIAAGGTSTANFALKKA
jgi:N-acetylneuraminic acid mutarotase